MLMCAGAGEGGKDRANPNSSARRGVRARWRTRLHVPEVGVEAAVGRRILLFNISKVPLADSKRFVSSLRPEDLGQHCKGLVDSLILTAWRRSVDIIRPLPEVKHPWKEIL